MSSNTATHDSSTDSDNYEADCGHTIPRDETAHYIGEFTHCEECYLDSDTPWFGVDDYPGVLRTRTVTVRNRRGASTRTSNVSLIGIREDRVAVYYNGIDDQLWMVAPDHSDYHDTEDAVRSPLREVHSDCTLGAPNDFGDDPFHTMPNGDHLALIATAEAPYSLKEWLTAHADEFRSFTDRFEPRSV